MRTQISGVDLPRDFCTAWIYAGMFNHARRVVPLLSTVKGKS
ncbi:hypothetical protein LJPFL01_2228 [Lelliottia jeotgali]|nr:hypothetical protein LJPFL01_2228 [Lelliottia jeotgali]